jgi:hypothetical protein
LSFSTTFGYCLCKICKECGYGWESKINNRTNGNGCPECKASKGEKKISKILNNYNIYYERQKSFEGVLGLSNGLLLYDFYLAEYNLCIEYDGEFHYKPIKNYAKEPINLAKERLKKQQIHDKIKSDYCKNNNINLLRIPYWDFDNIELILEEELILIKR